MNILNLEQFWGRAVQASWTHASSGALFLFGDAKSSHVSVPFPFKVELVGSRGRG